ncbi:GntR family transcriptional regulator [Haloactinopolyspora alba]|nr:GntR family transcriptional regulator [Haloactinopolyspora alba]
MLRSLIAEYRRSGSHRLPPEKELSDQLGLSRTSLRAALARLQSEGEIVRRRRVGTLINRPGQRWEGRSWLAYPVDMILSLSEYLNAVGVDYTVQAVGIRRDPASEDTAIALGLSPGSPVFSASRLYEVEGEPAAFVEHSLPTVLHGRDVHIESLTEGVTTFLRDTEHIRVTRAESMFTAEAASGDLSRELQVAEGAPLLVMQARLYSEGSSPVTIGRLVFRPDVLCLVTTVSEDASPDAATGLGAMPLVKPLKDATTTADEEAR